MWHRTRWLVSVALVVGMGGLSGAAESTAPAPDSAADSSIAAPPPAHDPIDSMMTHNRLHLMMGKLGRGLSNTLAGWLEIPFAVTRGAHQPDWFTGVLTGLFTGTFRGVALTGVGVYETVTFFCPCPPGYRPILPQLGYFDPQPTFPND